jgi:hypothetical protein
MMEELRQKQTAGTITPEEQRRLTRMENAFRKLDELRARDQPERRQPPRQMPRESTREMPRDLSRMDRPPAGSPPGIQPGRFAPQLERVLTADQRASLREMMLDQRERTQELEQRLREARRNLMQASLSPRFEEDVVRRTALEAGWLEGELAVLRGRALSRVKPPLSAEQMERIKNPPPMAAGEARPELRRDQRREELRREGPRPGDRPTREPRDEHDLPPPGRPRP